MEAPPPDTATGASYQDVNGDRRKLFPTMTVDYLDNMKKSSAVLSKI
ncbi:hypothetical protein [Fischerella sp. PCC 9605]|nr:hypothetical protein [Fischerella sp. PCC 9605]